MYLRQYKQKVQYLKGVGKKTALCLENLGIYSLADLLTHFPRDYIDRSNLDTLSQALKKERIHVLVKVIAHDFIGWGARSTLKVHIEDNTGRAVLLCFGRNFLKSVFLVGTTVLISGVFAYKFGDIQCANFEYEIPAEGSEEYTRILPVYPLTNGITQNMLRRISREALQLAGNALDDELPAYLLKKNSFPAKMAALANIHCPASLNEVARAKELLIFEELFYLQLIIGRKILKRKMERKQRAPVKFLHKKNLLSRLAFTLTPDQEKVIGEIEADLFSDYPMARLIQGDVGCGKTLVAVISSLAVIEAGEQVAFLAPTELLARQHAENIAHMLEPLGIRIALLSGSIREEARRLLLESLAGGAVDILIGTHALFSGDVEYRSLGLVIIDEQHKFGVEQRLALLGKGVRPDLLLMTATPIPRTLALTAFGDLDFSEIKTMPGGRKPIITHLTRQGNEQKVYERVKRELAAGRQAYFVYPLIEDSGKSSLKDAETMYRSLQDSVFREYRLGLIHSRINEEDKRSTMEAFAAGTIRILVATSVVEVGVDIPDATIMVIEHAERFGLSSLHQLRGRVGRSSLQSYAFLIYSNKLTEDGIRRLMIMKETCDGFRIAEEDLTIRGPGELLGVKQAGFLRLKAADFTRDREILLRARDAAFRIIQSDPGLLIAEHKVIRDVLLTAPPFDEIMLESG